MTKPAQHDLGALASGRMQEAVMWFYDTYGVSHAATDKATGLTHMKLPIDEFYEMVMTLHELWQERFLRSQHSDLEDEYKRYESLRLLIKSLTEKTVRV